MAATTIALTTAAGAMTLALTTTLMAWRARLRLSGSNQSLKEEVEAREAILGEVDAATMAFDEAYLAIEGEGVRLIWGDAVVKSCAEALGVTAENDDDLIVAVIETINRSSPEATAAIRGLVQDGRPCRFEVAGVRGNALVGEGTLVFEGKTAGTTAWVRLALSGNKASLATGPFAQLAERLPAPCWFCGADGALVWANTAWLKAVEAQSLDDAKARHLGLDRSVAQLIGEAHEAFEHREGFRWLTIEGHRRAYHITAEPLSDGHVCAYAIDVTEAEESREALKRHAKAHDETLDHLEDAVAIFGPEKRLMFYNRAFEELWDLESAWLSERPTHVELLERLRQKRRLPEMADFAGFKTKELGFYDLTQAAPDEMWSLPGGRSLRVVRQPHPLGGLLLLFSDKTDELKLKSQFNSLIQVQRATLDQLNDAISVFGSDGKMRLRNASFDRFWALNKDDVAPAMDLGPLSELCLPLVHDRNFWAELKARVTDTDPVARAPQSGEVATSDGRLAQWRTQPLPDGATLIVFNDITATRKLEKAIEDRDIALNESVRLKRDFVANVSYELRTPLTTIVGYADILQNMSSGLDDKSRSYLGSIQSAAQELARSIDDVLDMAQIDAGEMTITLGDLPLEALIHEARLMNDDALRARNVSFRFEGLPSGEPIRADGRRLRQVIDHLIGNAVRNAAQDGEVSVVARKDGDTLIMDVSHTGRGIPYHVQAHIFDRYVGRERGGPGLGLALVKALVELHEGWITLESEPDKGATFSVHLPHQMSVEAPKPEPLANPEPVADVVEEVAPVEDAIVTETLVTEVVSEAEALPESAPDLPEEDQAQDERKLGAA
jgi:signal transduction histidine kinase